MAEDYQDLVLATYKKKRDNNELSEILSRETTAGLKKACLRAYDNGRMFSEKDVDIIATFFDVDKLETDFRKLIRDTDPGDFRTLLKYIKGEITTTDVKNSDLLAWLIGFKARPSFTYYKLCAEGKFDPTDNDEYVIISTDKKDNGSSTKEPNPEPPKITPISKKHILAASIIFLIIGRIIFFVWDLKVNQIRMPDAGEKCMYWTGNHYEPIKCDEQVGFEPVMPLNMEQLKKQRKISSWDPITKTELKRSWYEKVGADNIELFTDSGVYPLDTTRTLNRMTDYMINKYDLDKRLIPKYIDWFYSITVLLLLIWFIIINLEKKRLANQAK